jgi:hypothetical protein
MKVCGLERPSAFDHGGGVSLRAFFRKMAKHESCVLRLFDARGINQSLGVVFSLLFYCILR